MSMKPDEDESIRTHDPASPPGERGDAPPPPPGGGSQGPADPDESSGGSRGPSDANA